MTIYGTWEPEKKWWRLIELPKPSLGSWVLLRSLRIVDKLKMKTTTTKEMGRGGRGNRVREIVPMRR